MYRTVPLFFLPTAFFCVMMTTTAFAQEIADAPDASASVAAEPPPPPGWTGSFGAGLALTQGNRDTSTINVSYETKRDFGAPFLFRSTGLFLRGETEGELTANRLVLDVRVDQRLSPRTSMFGQLQYLSDEFKEIDYLISPSAGVAQQLVENEKTELAVDTGVGIVSEDNEGKHVRTAGAVTAGQNFKHKLTATAEITQKMSALWKMSDFGDALYMFGIGLSANITAQTKLKAEVLDTLKNRPPSDAVQKNDVAVLLSFVYKFSSRAAPSSDRPTPRALPE